MYKVFQFVAAVAWVAGCQTAEPQIAPVDQVRLADQGFLRSGSWVSSDVRLAVVTMARDYGWVQTRGWEETVGRKGEPSYVTQILRTYHAPSGMGVEVRWIEEAAQGLRVFVTTEPRDQKLMARIVADLAARVEHSRRGAPPPAPDKELLGPRLEEQDQSK